MMCLAKNWDFITKEDVENEYWGYMIVSITRKEAKHRDITAKGLEK